MHVLVYSSDVMKLVKICIRRMRILTLKICRMQIEAFVLSVNVMRWFRSIKWL